MGSGNSRFIAALAAVMVASSVAMYACQAGPAGAAGGTADAAQAVYVPPGEYDEFYAFMSGGFSGNLTVMGLPSGRLDYGSQSIHQASTNAAPIRVDQYSTIHPSV